MRNTFVKTLLEIAKKDKNVLIVTGDLGFGVLKPFWDELPDQIINAGIAEQNMTSVAAGLAMSGKTVITYSIGNFPTLRCLEQIRNDCAYHNANVKVVCVGGGFVYGSLGMSHHATEDLAVLRALPNVTVMAPGDLVEAECATRAMCQEHGTFYLRLGRGGEQRIHDKIENFAIGKAVKVSEGKDVAVFSTGAIFSEVAKAGETLAKDCITPTVYTFPTIKPIDKDAILSCARTHKAIITVEEHNLSGGFGSAVAEVLADAGAGTKLIRIGLGDVYSSIVGTQDYLRTQYGIDADHIVSAVKGVL
jgi:transketolase